MDQELESKEKQVVQLPDNLSIRAMRCVWVAFRSEYIAFGRGREKFAAALEDAVCKIECTHRFAMESGECVSPTKFFPSPQTYYNFFRSGLSKGVGDNSTSKANTRTLRVILIFLYSRKGANLIKLLKQYRSEYKNPLVDNLDHSFAQYYPHEILPRTFALLETGEEGVHRRPPELFNGVKTGTVSALDNFEYKFHAAICIRKSREGLSLVEAVFSEDLRLSPHRKDKFDSKNRMLPGSGILFQSKDFVSSQNGVTPKISNDAYYLVISRTDKLTRSSSTISMRLSLSSNEEQSPYLRVPQDAVCQLDRDGFKQYFYVVPISGEEENHIFKNCHIFGSSV